jgi:hypothetical protein
MPGLARGRGIAVKVSQRLVNSIGGVEGRELGRRVSPSTAPSVLAVVPAIEGVRKGGGRRPRVVLVEGESDLLALTALARRRGRDLDAEGVIVVAMGGATKLGTFLIGLRHLDVEVAGLCDVGEEHHFRNTLDRAGFDIDLTRSDMEELGFFVCDADLEDELIRALGIDAALDVAARQGELDSFRRFQTQLAWRNRSGSAQFRRWLGTKARRKLDYAPLLVDALDLDRVPGPLDRILAHVTRSD